MEREMDKMDNLIIRACRSKDPMKRLRSIHRHVCRWDKDPFIEDGLFVLSRISDEYVVRNQTMNFILGVRRLVGQGNSPDIAMLLTLVQEIRWVRPDILAGYIAPISMRRKTNE